MMKHLIRYFLMSILMLSTYSLLAADKAGVKFVSIQNAKESSGDSTALYLTLKITHPEDSSSLEVSYGTQKERGDFSGKRFFIKNESDGFYLISDTQKIQIREGSFQIFLGNVEASYYKKHPHFLVITMKDHTGLELDKIEKEE